MEAKKRNEIAVLIRAGTAPKDIKALVGASCTTILAVRRRLESGADPHPRPRNPRRPTKRTPRAVAAVRRRIKTNPNKSITKIAEEVGMHRSTASRLIKKDGGQSLRRKKCPLFSEAARHRRLERSRGLLNDLKSAPRDRIVFFCDEKNFVVDPTFNPQNDRFIRIGPACGAPNEGEGDAEEGPRPQYMPRSKKPASLMFLGIIASTGEVCQPIWFPAGFRLSADDYIKVLKSKVCLLYTSPSPRD